ncbi:isocitrate/isopropylmalate family dehydrogenase [Pseudonocardia acaciae]|uniref:isocitrate/isopropylmalate family dehydrogenase n=1 Tax=Pseudonocardia acaciae TaxID=551276 RepID=UPI000490056B|nr:isocitrate/isopropylmalate family dehydrogenase [Pseudonocardia acaciae]
MSHRIILLPGDGIGPEVTAAARAVLDASGADLDWEVHQAGLTALAAGAKEPLPRHVVEAIADRGVALKGPFTTPADGSMPSVNIALRRELDLYANARHVRTLPGVPGRHVDLIIIRETTEDVYAGIELAEDSAEELADWLRARGMPVPAGAALAVKVASAAGARRAFEFAADYAEHHGRRRLTAVHKATVLPATDGLFVATGRAVVTARTHLEFDTIAVDALAAHLVQRPEELDVLVLPGQYGDIMADLGGALVGGIGMVPGVNHGSCVSLFEPAHGSAPRHAGRNRANPVATILSGALALRRLGEDEAARRVEDAVAAALADGRHTYDLTPHRSGDGALGTAEFAAAVISKLL